MKNETFMYTVHHVSMLNYLVDVNNLNYDNLNVDANLISEFWLLETFHSAVLNNKL